MDVMEQGACYLKPLNHVLLMYWSRDEELKIIFEQSEILWDKACPVSADTFFPIVADEDAELLRLFSENLRQMLKDGDSGDDRNRVDVSVRLKESDGRFHYHAIEVYMTKSNGMIERMTIAVRELSAEEVYRINLAKTVTNDRSPAMFNKLSREILQSHPEKSYALIQFDVAKFKAINELYGEAFGDELIDFFIESLKVICAKEQLYVRLTADVFMILTAYKTRQELIDFVKLVNQKLLGYKETTYRLVFGICCIGDINENLRKYGDGAAVARQSIKENALELMAFYEEGMKTSILSNKYLEDHMEQALINREFMIYLQPKYDLITEEIIGAEALVRWNNKDKGFMSPADFIPLFEKNGFITRLDAFVWEEACRLIRRWLDEGRQCIPISVNMSRIHLRSGEYTEILERLIDTYKIPKKYLEIELTESADEADVHGKIRTLKENGYTLLMDDFGSGYSSLNTLKDTQFDIIKLDRIFFQDFVSSIRGKEIIRHVIQMTDSLGIGTVAEGVETKEQADFLMKCGCSTAQGFYYAKPMPVDEFYKLMQNGEN